MTAEGLRPTITDLESLIRAHANNGEFRLHITSFEDALPERTLVQDSDVALADQANTAFIEQLHKHVVKKENTELLTINGRLNFIRGSLGYGDQRLARRLKTIRSPWEEKGDTTIADSLGITENQVERGDMRGRRQGEIDRFEERFNGLFTLSSLLAESVEDVIDRRVAIHTPNGKLSNISIADALKAGFINIAVAIALETVRVNEMTQDQLTTQEINDNQVVLDPEDYKPESISDGLYDDSRLFQERTPEGNDHLTDTFDDEPA
jgi:hypothetical protein